MSTFYAATVTIGRNIGDKPMSPIRWATFRAGVRSVLVGEGLEVTASNSGEGRWQDSAGSIFAEENHVVVAIFDAEQKARVELEYAQDDGIPLRSVAEHTTAIARATRNAIAGHLEVLAAVYEQDAIAFAWGESILVASSA